MRKCRYNKKIVRDLRDLGALEDLFYCIDPRFTYPNLKGFLVDSIEMICPWISDIFRKESLALPLGQKNMKKSEIISKRYDKKQKYFLQGIVLFTEKIISC